MRPQELQRQEAAGPGAPGTTSLSMLESLPNEVFLHILSFLSSHDVAVLQIVSKQLLRIGRDSGFWRARCFEESLYVKSLLQRRMLASMMRPSGDQTMSPLAVSDLALMPDHERVRILANWDPSFPGERVSWFEEYTHRNAPIVVNWFQLPHTSQGSKPPSGLVDACGMALYRPDGGDCDSVLAVSPLDDGSVCLWDVNGTQGRRGAMAARSAPGMLFVESPDSSERQTSFRQVDYGVTECVSVDSQRHLAYFAVQNDLVTVDLKRLSVAGRERFPWPITALSSSHPTVPLTVGLRAGIHLYDSRSRGVGAARADGDEIVDALPPVSNKQEKLNALLRQGHYQPPRYAQHPQPGPLCLLHLQQPGSEHQLSDDIYAAGRIPNILHYDRRNLSHVKDSIHSGSSLSSLASLPYAFSVVDSELRRQGALSAEQVHRAKTVAGSRTIVACGEYKTKGSLELYGVGVAPRSTYADDGPLEVQYRQDSAMKNRQSSSPSKLFSVACHGTRLVYSDGSGRIRWVERDGVTEVRTCTIGRDEGSDTEAMSSLFSSTTVDSDDIARKLLPTRPAGNSRGDSLNNNDLLFWTGDKLGLVTFSSGPGFRAEDFAERMKTEQEMDAEKEERVYSLKMRQLLERQADDVRAVRNLGFGNRPLG